SADVPWVAGVVLRKDENPAPMAGEWVLSGIEEILQERLARLGQDGFGMELDPFHRKGLMTDPHDLPILAGRGDLETIGDRFFFNDQRVVAGGSERIGKPLEYAFAVVGDLAGFPMHQLFGPDDIPAKSEADALVAQADP